MKISLGVWIARRELSFMSMAWASPKSQPSASFPIKMQKIHKWHGSSMYRIQPALPHSWCLFAGQGEDENPGEWEGQSGKIQRLFLFFNPLIGIRVLSPLPAQINTSASIEFSSHCHDISWKIITYCCSLLLPFKRRWVSLYRATEQLFWPTSFCLQSRVDGVSVLTAQQGVLPVYPKALCEAQAIHSKRRLTWVGNTTECWGYCGE